MSENVGSLSAEASITTLCTSVATRFMARFDANDGAGMAELFTQDGEWARADGVVKGRAALLELMAQRSSSVLLLHVLTNFVVDVLSPDRALVRSIVTVYRHEFSRERTLPAPLDGPHAIGRYVDELVLTDRGWKITRKSSEPVLIRNETPGRREK